MVHEAPGTWNLAGRATIAIQGAETKIGVVRDAGAQRRAPTLGVQQVGHRGHGRLPGRGAL